MTDTKQPEALRLALSISLMDTFTNYQQEELDKAAAELRRQHARIAELEAQLEAIGAGGVSGPLMGKPQEMPDLTTLTERGAKAWTGVDAQGLRDGAASAGADCALCGGSGEVFEHSEDCDDDLCALNGDMHSCTGIVRQCACKAPASPTAVGTTQAYIAAMERAWLWMENQADAQSKGGHATFDLMMLREERDALRAAIDAAASAGSEPVAPAGATVLCWVNEDELPEGLTQEAYSALFPHSKVDGVRMFPIFGSTPQADSVLEDAAFEAVRKKLCALPRYSFALDSRGNVRRCEDKSGNWIEFDAAHALFDPVAADAARKQGGAT